MTQCPRCNGEVPEGSLVCGTCGFNLSSPPPPPVGDNPWERREELGLGKALIETVKMVITNPVGLFSSIRKTATGEVQYYMPSSLDGSGRFSTSSGVWPYRA